MDLRVEDDGSAEGMILESRMDKRLGYAESVAIDVAN